ncbi:MAG: S-layer homology domain-containing protein [Tumebacillaceae bacterium]
MDRFFKKNLHFVRALLVMLCVLIASPGFAFAEQQSGTAASDLSGHWAEKQIVQWVDKGLIAGYPDGTYQPDHTITRAEFITLVNRSLKLTGEADVRFTDVVSDSWEHAQVAAALAAGYLSGYDDGTFRPGQEISREEAVSVLERALKLEPNPEAATKFSDAHLFSDWSMGAIGALAAKGFLNGFEDGTFHPGQSMTRAESIVMLDRATVAKTIAMTYDQKGTYGPESGTQVIEGNVLISAGGVTLRNTLINGDLLLASTIGDGDVFLKGVTVKGTTDVQGGGAHSVHMEDSVLLSIIVNREDGTVRIVAEGSTSIQSITLQSSSVLQASAQGVRIEDVILSRLLPANAETTLEGSFSNLSVEATSIRVNLSGGTIENLLLSAQAANTTLNLDSSATVSSMVLNSAADVRGNGTIHRADVNVNGSSFEHRPERVNTPPGVIIRDTVGNHDGSNGKGTGNNTPATYTVRGQIIDANNAPVSGVSVKFKQDWFATNGPVIASLVTDATGSYTVTLPPGKYTGDLAKEGFLASSLYLLVASNGEISDQNKKIVRIPEPEETRIVMYWGQLPRDIDSHLVGPTPDGSQFHTWYWEKAHHFEGTKYADLDIDHTKSWGPETTTIRHDVDGVYRFYVHNYSGQHYENKTLRESGATIEVYRGKSAVPLKSYRIPGGTGNELYFTPFEMTIHNGEVTFADINQFYTTEAEAKGNNAAVNAATVSSALYTVQYPDITVVSDAIYVDDFKAGLIVPTGASLEVFESDGTTVRTGTVADGDKVVVTAQNGITRVTYTVQVEGGFSERTVSRLLYTPQNGLTFTTPDPKQIVATALYSDGSREDVTALASYQILDPLVASVDQTGLVTPLADGTTTVQILYGGQSAFVPITVNLSGTAPTVSRLLYTPQSMGIEVANTPLSITIEALYSDGTRTTVTDVADYYVANSTLAMVDRQAGAIYGMASGITDIQVRYGGQTISFAVTLCLAPKGSANGTTLNVDNLIPGAQLLLRSVTGELLSESMTANQFGEAQFTGLTPGMTYYVQQRFNGFLSTLSNGVTI